MFKNGFKVNVLLKKDNFYEILDKYKDYLMKNYDKRKEIINFKINNKEYSCSKANLFTQLVFFIPFYDLKLDYKVLNDFVILDEIKTFNNSTVPNYFNTVISYLDENNYDVNDYKNLNLSFKKILNIFCDNSGYYNIFSGTTINLREILEAIKNNKEFHDLFYEKVPSGLDYSEINEFISNQFNKEIEILKNFDNCFKPYLVTKTGINAKQFKEVISKIGLKADLNGEIIPYVINTNFLMGLNGITEFYINCVLARKALITSHRQVRNSGYFTRKLSLLLIDTMLSSIDDCNTDEYVNVLLDNDDVINRYNLRYFLNEDGYLERFDSNIHKYLKGKILKFRSPSKCKCKDGKVCRTCYGDLYKVNHDIHIGIVGILELTEQLTQSLLSAKHLQEVRSTVLDWKEEFLKYFTVDTGKIIANTEKASSGITLIFDDEDIDLNENNDIVISSFKIKNKRGGEVVIDLPVQLIPSEDVKEVLINNPARNNNNQIVLSFKNLCEFNDSIFTFSLENNELSASLQSLINLIESSDHLGINNIDDIINKFMELLKEGNIRLAAVHAELIIRELCRKSNNYLERPERFDCQDDINNENHYTILKVSEAISNSPSSAVSLSFERIKQQLQSPSLYLKNKTSILDELFFQ